MQPHQERVIAEQIELQDRLDKLTAFFATDMFKSLPIAEQARMEMQSFYMGGYSDILKARIKKFA
jgi:hypothetical protein